LSFVIWLLEFLEKDRGIYLPLSDIEHSRLGYLLRAHYDAVLRVAKFPNHDRALEAIERIEAEIKRRDALELARTETNHAEPTEPVSDVGEPMQKEPMPCSVRVADRTYRIEVWDTELAQQARSNGCCELVKKLILIDTSYGDYQAASTLIHEILHAIYEEYNVEGDDGEERTVRSLGRGLMQVFLDNPDLLQFIAESTTGARLALTSDKPRN
jgi:hypothetical protein